MKMLSAEAHPQWRRAQRWLRAIEKDVEGQEREQIHHFRVWLCFYSLCLHKRVQFPWHGGQERVAHEPLACSVTVPCGCARSLPTCCLFPKHLCKF